MYPAVWFLNHVANWILRLVGIQVSNEGEAAHTEEEIRILMEESHKQGDVYKRQMVPFVIPQSWQLRIITIKHRTSITYSIYFASLYQFL